MDGTEGRGLDVLIVDDDEAVRLAYTRALEQAGYQVTAVENGLAALVQLQEHTYRAIVCDVHMRFLEGRGFFAELLEDYPDMAQRVVFATGWASHDEIGPFLAQAGRPVLTKPVDLEVLTATVRDVVERA